MEKKRRARINTCLNQLKSLVLQAMNKDSSQYSKLEKADILEMTVNFLKAVPQQKARAASHETVGAIAKYNSGFTECAAEVGRYLGSVQGVDGEVRSRVLNHLSHRMNAIQTSQPTAPPPATHSQPSIQPVYVQIPNTTPVIPGVHTASYPATTPVSTSGPHHQGALVVMPSAVVLPTPVTVQHSWQQQHQQQQLLQQNFVMPLSPPSSRGCSPVSSVSQTPVPVRHSAIQGVQKSSVPTNVDLKSEQLWRPW
ncbi:transcription factor HES-2-like [Liolophura sinensis]|uniref:transcription factor HES-2-like n=1 Tax=Liolophura sinensis TaxID=3198878 RepID=UPI003158754A